MLDTSWKRGYDEIKALIVEINAILRTLGNEGTFAKHVPKYEYL